MSIVQFSTLYLIFLAVCGVKQLVAGGLLTNHSPNLGASNGDSLAEPESMLLHLYRVFFFGSLLLLLLCISFAVQKQYLMELPVQYE